MPRNDGVYPRACGGTNQSSAAATGFEGLSPRMRGNPVGRTGPVVRCGSIPAHAGEPVLGWSPDGWRWVYPRACGGTEAVPDHWIDRVGLSPRMRGNRGGAWADVTGLGSIPAHAGEPRTPNTSTTSRRVYPRACGGTSSGAALATSLQGLSPRMRGNLEGLGLVNVRLRSIPAHAGEPAPRNIERRMLWVYPRACGGTHARLHRPGCHRGLSPRMRGNLVRSFSVPPWFGSIPAHAGEPPIPTSSTWMARVYPRACGGTTAGNPASVRETGLSPRMRGNLRRIDVRFLAVGSIPAHAGEPPADSGTSLVEWVYPRACGGTAASACPASTYVGLSPRMRGNPGHPNPCRECRGSIPAHAGEPERALAVNVPVAVYPRACGGTPPRFRGSSPQRGLSPRMRGNRITSKSGAVVYGSIPAHAGEPEQEGPQERDGRVYPRACGGTQVRRFEIGARPGLSPRMRGNLHVIWCIQMADGSIPAHAGEPPAPNLGWPMLWVYPRACGGTATAAACRPHRSGLSPRMRGNHRLPCHSPAYQGSIPAHAGEPAPPWLSTSCRRVYPRACGGTANVAILYLSDQGLSPRMRGNPL